MQKNMKNINLIDKIAQEENKIDKYIILLTNKYGLTLTKTELAEVINKSEQTIDRRIKEGIGIPQFIRSGRGKKASYIFPIYEVAKYLSENLTKTM